MVVRGNLEWLGGIPQALDPVDNDAPAGNVPKKPLRIPQPAARARQLAV